MWNSVWTGEQQRNKASGIPSHSQVPHLCHLLALVNAQAAGNGRHEMPTAGEVAQTGKLKWKVRRARSTGAISLIYVACVYERDLTSCRASS